MLAADIDVSELWQYLKQIDQRLTKVEESLKINSISEVPESITQVESRKEMEGDALEFKIGQFWFAKIGIFAFLFGIIFFLTLPLNDLSPSVPLVIGVISSLVFLIIPVFIRKTLSYLSDIVTGSGIILLYITALRLHFISPIHLVENRLVELTILSFVFLLSIYLSLKRKSKYLASLSILLGYSTALVGDRSYFIFLMIMLIGSLSVYYKLKYRWEYILSLSIFFGYLTHLLWYIGNPFIANRVINTALPQFNFLFQFIYLIIFNTAYTLKRIDETENASKIFNTIINSLLFYGMLTIITIAPENLRYFGFSHTAAALVFLFFSSFFWLKEKSKYLTFLYAMFGYLALSSAIIYEFEIPNSFIWLCWQSILVISTAVWYRSKFIIIANFIIYLLILLAYLVTEKNITAVSLSFGIVPLISARILNWQKDRLELKTEYMRNAYLIVALLFIPFVLYRIVPEGFIALSWVGVAILYFIISLLLNNKKYRWMAVLTFVMTIIYVSILGITSSQLGYKILSFLVLGSVLFAISVVYSRMKTQQTKGILDRKHT